MSIFKKMSERFYYFIDNFRVNNINAKIEHFTWTCYEKNITVVYRLGRKKLLNKMPLDKFEDIYFEKISHYDRYRLIKILTLQMVEKDLLFNGSCTKDRFMNYVKEYVKNEQLF